MEIEFYCEDSPSFVFTPPDIYGRGVGGAELALISLTETLAKRGHQVTVWNTPPTPGEYDGVTYKDTAEFDFWRARDVFVLFRNSTDFLPVVNARKRVFWSTDQMTTWDYKEAIYPFVDFAVCISEYHKQDHIARYGIRPERIHAIDLGVRLQDYEGTVPKVPGKVIYCSIPHRGAAQLAKIWPLVLAEVPDAHLVLTGDYSLWGRGIKPGCEDIRELYKGVKNAEFLGNIPRKELVKHQMEAEVMAYPHVPVNGLPELFCLSVAECQVAGTVPVTSGYGGLATTNRGGWIEWGNPDDELYQRVFAGGIVNSMWGLFGQPGMVQKARQRFDWNRIAVEWENLLG